MINNYGELYLDHYINYLGKYEEVYNLEIKEGVIQLMSYEGVFEDCCVITTLGVSIHQRGVELVLVSEGGLEENLRILGNMVNYGITKGVRLARGTSISGVGNIDRKFEQMYGKSAIYFTDMFGLPDNFFRVGNTGSMLLAFYITEDEYNYLNKYGVEEFEDRLEESGGDPFEIGRKSSV